MNSSHDPDAVAGLSDRGPRVTTWRALLFGGLCLVWWWSPNSLESVVTAGLIYTTSFNRNVLDEEWSTRVQRLADHSTASASEGRLRIRTDGGCYRNAATVEIGQVSNQIRLAYEWEAAASGWYEVPKTTVYENSTTVWETTHPPCPGDRTVPDGRVSGLDDQVLSVDGTLEIEFAVAPSQHCGADDHGWTEYTIHNLVVETA